VIRRRQRRSAANPTSTAVRLAALTAPSREAPAAYVTGPRLGIHRIHLSFVSSLSGGIRSARGVGDFTDELFENVFECNQSSGLAVLVDQASEV
jgi:hypothetical protein